MKANSKHNDKQVHTALGGSLGTEGACDEWELPLEFLKLFLIQFNWPRWSVCPGYTRDRGIGDFHERLPPTEGWSQGEGRGCGHGCPDSKTPPAEENAQEPAGEDAHGHAGGWSGVSTVVVTAVTGA